MCTNMAKRVFLLLMFFFAICYKSTHCCKAVLQYLVRPPLFRKEAFFLLKNQAVRLVSGMSKAVYLLSLADSLNNQIITSE